MTQQPETIDLLVGKVGRAHGLRGEVSIDVRTDEPDRRFADDTQFMTSRGLLRVASSKWHGQRLLVTFAEVTDRTAAEALRGTELRIAVPADARPDDPEEFYDHQLVGLRGEDEAGEVLGEITEVLHLPAQDVLVLRRDGRDVLIPFVTEIVPEIDLAARRVVIVAQPGLLEEEPEEEADEEADSDRAGSARRTPGAEQ